MLAASSRAALGNEQGQRSLKFRAAGQFDAASLSLANEVRQTIRGQRLA
jgi:hypothetical protein